MTPDDASRVSREARQVRAARRVGRSRGGWWIGEGPERCPFCFQGYAMEVEMRCVACDVPGCMHCMVRLRSPAAVEVWCPECREDHQEGGGQGGCARASEPVGGGMR